MFGRIRRGPRDGVFHTFPLRGLGALLALVLVVGCGDDDGLNGPSDAVDFERLALRASDGLLNDAVLQEVVALQLAHDLPGLIARLSDSDSNIRARAAFALGSLQDARAVEALIPLLSDPEASVRADAAFALGQLVDYDTGHTELAQGLLSVLEAETDPMVRRRLLDAVGMAGTEPAAARFAGMTFSASEMPYVVLALSRIGIRERFVYDYGTIVDWLSRQLVDPDPEVRWAAAYYFGRVDNEDAWTRWRGNLVDALESYAPDELAAVPLISVLDGAVGVELIGRYARFMEESPDWRIRRAVAEVLPILPPDRPFVVDASIAALDDPSHHVRMSFASQFSTLLQAPDELKEPLKAWIGSNRDRWQETANLLAPLARGGEGEFVFAWLDTLGTISDEAFETGLRAMSEVSGDDIVALTWEYAQSADSARSVAAWRSLGDRWPNEPVNSANIDRYMAIFSEGITHSDPTVARIAAEAMADTTLQNRGSYALVRAQVQAALEADDMDRAGALARGLAAMDGEGLAETLSPLRDHPDSSVRRAVRLRLRSLGVDVPSDPEADDMAAVDWARLQALGRFPRLRIETDKGAFTAILASEVAPQTVDAITRYAERGAYDGLPFHRVVSDFVVQGGDFSLGSAGESAEIPMRSQLTGIPYLRGVLGMARGGALDSESSQFFVTHSSSPHLDQGYGAFGWVVEGMTVVDEIEQGDRIVRITVESGDTPMPSGDGSGGA